MLDDKRNRERQSDEKTHKQRKRPRVYCLPKKLIRKEKNEVLSTNAYRYKHFLLLPFHSPMRKLYQWMAHQPVVLQSGALSARILMGFFQVHSHPTRDTETVKIGISRKMVLTVFLC